MSDFKVIFPHGITNLFTNPEFGNGLTDWTAGILITATLQSDDRAFGLYSVEITLATGDALYQTLSDANVQYTLSCYVKVSDAVTIATGTRGYFDTTVVVWDTITAVGNGWYRCEYTGTGGVNTGRYGIWVIGGEFYVDGFQLETGAEASTYCDGDQEGCVWNGVAHASTSTRSAVSRAGGLIDDLEDDLHFDISSFSGGEIAPQNVNIDSFSILPGGALNSIKIRERFMTMTGVIRGTSLENLHANKQELVGAILPDSYPQTAEGYQPVRLRYTGAAIEKEIKAHYHSMLEGNLDSRQPCAWERAAIRWACPDPFWYAILDSAQLLDTNDSDTFRIVAQRLRADGQWDSMGPPNVAGTYTEIWDIVIADNGDVYFGGDFQNFDNDNDADRIVLWNGTAFSWPAGEGVDDGEVRALVLDQNGILYVGGTFTAVSGAMANTNRIAYWDESGGAWGAMGTSSDDNSVYALVVDAMGHIYAGGDFTGMGGVGNTARIAYWDGAAWNALSNGVDDGRVQALARGLDNTIYVGGTFTTVDGGSAYVSIAQWDGTNWASMGDSNNAVAALAIDPIDGTLYAGGNFTTIGGITSAGLARWNGTTWEDISGGLPSGWTAAQVIKIGPDRKVYVGGDGINSVIVGSGAGSDWVEVDINFSNVGGTNVYAIAVGNQDPVISQNYDIYVGYDDSGTLYYGGIATATNAGTEIAFPRFIIERTGGTSATIVSLRNETTGKQLFFDYDLLDGEQLIIDMTPTNKSITSSFFGPRPDAIQSLSDFGDWSLLPGDNDISCFIDVSGAPTITAWLEWRNQYNGVD